MIDFSYNLVRFCMQNANVFPVALCIAAGNMLVQGFFNLIFGSKGLPKLRGYRGE